MVGLALSVALNPLNSTMIAVALAPLGQDRHLSFSQLAWVLASYYLAAAVAQPLLGRIGDRTGHRRLYCGGLAVLAVGSALAPLAPGLAGLIGARLVQALGSSALYPAAIGLIRHEVPMSQRTRAVALIATAAAAAAGLGPVLGGWLVALGGWEAVFLVNVPACAVGLTAALLRRGGDPTPAARGCERRSPLDTRGVALFAVAMSAAVAATGTGDDDARWVSIGISAGAGALFVCWERRTPHPFIDVRAIGRRIGVGAIYPRFAVVNAVYYAVLFGVPTYLTQIRDLGPAAVGAVMLAVSGVGALATAAGGRAIDRLGTPRVMLAGVIAMSTGVAVFAVAGAAIGLGLVIVALGVLGIGVRLGSLALEVSLVRVAPAATIGTASGLLQTARYTGTIAATALLGLVFGTNLGAGDLQLLGVVLTTLCALLLAGSVRSQSERR
ncbi:MAG: MFS transporter [Solirubrobacteraceae bacterium]|nr:MFS transporter [Solirubrobacteraceae bacterium]